MHRRKAYGLQVIHADKARFTQLNGPFQLARNHDVLPPFILFYLRSHGWSDRVIGVVAVAHTCQATLTGFLAAMSRENMPLSEASFLWSSLKSLRLPCISSEGDTGRSSGATIGLEWTKETSTLTPDASAILDGYVYEPIRHHLHFHKDQVPEYTCDVGVRRINLTNWSLEAFVFVGKAVNPCCPYGQGINIATWLSAMTQFQSSVARVDRLALELTLCFFSSEGRTYRTRFDSSIPLSFAFPVGQHIRKGEALLQMNAGIQPSHSNSYLFQRSMAPLVGIGLHSPTDRVPNEILLRIFSEHVQEDYRLTVEEHVDEEEDVLTGVTTIGLSNHVNKNGRAALVLAHVSPLWRSLTTKSKKFWTAIHLDTIQPAWFLQLLYWSRDASLSFFSEVPFRPVDKLGVHVWSLAHTHFQRCNKLHVHVSIDPKDARCLGGLLAMDAPKLEECSIHYIPHPNNLFARRIGRRHETGVGVLFNGRAPLLRSIHLVDCHLPPYQAFFPNLLHFYTTIATYRDQTDDSQRRGLPEFMSTIQPSSRIEIITLIDAIDHSFHPSHDYLPDIDSIPLPHLHEFQFLGSAYAASHLLRIFRPPARCSFFLNVDARQWDEQSAQDFMTSMANLLSPISSQTDAQSWSIGLDADGTILVRVTGTAVFELSFSTGLWGDGLGLHSLNDEEVWSLHPRRLRLPPLASRSPADIAYSSILRVLSSRFRPALEAARTLELNIPESDFAFSQTTHILEQMPNITQLTLRHCKSEAVHLVETCLIVPTSPGIFPQLSRRLLPPVIALTAISAFRKLCSARTSNGECDHLDAEVRDIELSFLQD
ncbi:hypothetical protein NMY22_g19185 [Coprinellus aureogranulatus]|nr:hypothetical protein NMY22_g19185 [Coprinellus aureogranulatus]